ncbi:hypothetical protein GCM10018781_03480 [Kitasatospora indigofera]|uniref:Uncharacterized protein n=1 Tax=Kitasatospora indigofera TaxID=67307 RepID=A0A919KKH3_9ACTN|nr:hypothetical protein GCM10018781_03480 [Kitasatospora indigofera]
MHPVGGNDVALTEQEHVARHDGGGGYRAFRSVSQDACRGGGQGGQSRDRAVGPDLLDHPDRGVSPRPPVPPAVTGRHRGPAVPVKVPGSGPPWSRRKGG